LSCSAEGKEGRNKYIIMKFRCEYIFVISEWLSSSLVSTNRKIEGTVDQVKIGYRGSTVFHYTHEVQSEIAVDSLNKFTREDGFVSVAYVYMFYIQTDVYMYLYVPSDKYNSHSEGIVVK
jgi:hypothetical protein